MNPLLITAILVGLVTVSTVIGLMWRGAQGRVRRSNGETIVSSQALGVDLPLSDITLLQFSSPLCAPCRATHVVLNSIAGQREGVEHVEIDLSERPELASEFRIAQTPTTFILDRDGVVRARIGGALKRDAVIAEIDSILVTA
ncbi:thiol-disulfide isomerase/thioredoxin [Salinibacterium sp. CAN_S4]|uniref:TlpA family protein disulfide reductase n=1 Tax=Salinibacterium sp. CAN_S4 TaxID=2787727 RepID=UPI0018EF9956